MDIRQIGNVPGGLDSTSKKRDSRSVGSTPSSDKIEISTSARAAQEAAQLAKIAREEPDVRSERVEETRRALAEGTLFSQEALRSLGYIQ